MLRIRLPLCCSKTYMRDSTASVYAWIDFNCATTTSVYAVGLPLFVLALLAQTAAAPPFMTAKKKNPKKRDRDP